MCRQLRRRICDKKNKLIRWDNLYLNMFLVLVMLYDIKSILYLWMMRHACLCLFSESLCRSATWPACPYLMHSTRMTQFFRIDLVTPAERLTLSAGKQWCRVPRSGGVGTIIIFTKRYGDNPHTFGSGGWRVVFQHAHCRPKVRLLVVPGEQI